MTTWQVAILLSYPSAGAARQGDQCGTLPVPLYRLGSRRLLARLADIQNLLTERPEPPRPSTQGAMTKEEAS